MNRRPGYILTLGFVAWFSCCMQDHAVAASSDWAYHNGDSDETNYSPLSQLSPDTVKDLGLAWYLDLPDEASLEATPLEVGGVVYFPGSYGKVYAVDGVGGKLLWTYDPEVWKYNPGKMHLNFGVNRGVAYANGKIFLATFDGRLQALNAATGNLIWSVETTPHDSVYFITGAPRAFNDKVLIGNAGGDLGARGYVSAYEQETGRQAWRFYVAPGSPEENRGDPAMERAATTWSGEFWKTGTGGSVWDSMTFDAKLNRIYIATGNAGPTDAEKRSPGRGDNLYTNSTVALDADSGKYLWHYQFNPRDAWNFDCTQQMTLTEMVIDGKPRDVLMQAPKNGFFYVIDRHYGKLISAEKFGKATWAERIDLQTGRPVEAPNARYERGETVLWPNPVGAHSWQSMSYSSKTGLVYIPYMQNGARFYRGPARRGDFEDFGVSLGSVKAGPEDGKGALVAWDPVRQQLRWRAWYDTLLNGGTLSTAGNLVFQGAADGYFMAFDAATGKRLWRFNAGIGIIASPMSYEMNDKQYVSILVGYGGVAGLGSDVMDAGWKWNAHRRLLTFARGGLAQLPPSAPRAMRVHALDDSGFHFTAADVREGEKLSMQCIVCHGRDLSPAGGAAPDLRESAIPLNSDNFWTVVHGGALITSGMPKFADLTPQQANQLRAYIRATARRASVQSESSKATRVPHIN